MVYKLKRSIVIMLAFIMTFMIAGVFSTYATNVDVYTYVPSADDFTWNEEDFTYSEDKTTLTGLSDTGKEKLKVNSELVLPDTHDGVDITEIGNGVTGMNKLDGADGQVGTFGFNENNVTYVPTKVKFPSNLKKIGNMAFMAAYNGTDPEQKGLTELKLPATLEEIGQQAFTAVPITEVTIPDNVKTIGQAAFSGTQFLETKITKVVFPDNPKFDTIPQSCFATQLISEVKIPKGVKTIGRMAFTGNEVKVLELPAGLETIENQAFMNHQLEKITIPGSVKTINQSAFRVVVSGSSVKPSTLVELNIPDDSVLGTIGKQAFDGSSLQIVNIPASVTALHADAFKDCQKGSDEDKKVLLKVASQEQFNGTNDFKSSGSGHKVSVTVTFDSNGGTPVDPETVQTKLGLVLAEDDLKDATSTDAAKEFIGWFTDAEGGDAVDANTLYKKNTTLYAHWKDYKAEASAAAEAAKEAREKADKAKEAAYKSKAAAEAAAKTPGQEAVDSAKKAEEDARAAADAADASKKAADEAKAKADALADHYKKEGSKATAEEKANASVLQANAAALQATAAALQATAAVNVNAAEKALSDAKSAAKTAQDAAAEEKVKTVIAVSVNTKTVNAGEVDKVVKAAGGSEKYVTTIVLGKEVRKISKSTFKNYKNVKVLEIKTKKLNKKSVKGSLKGSSITKVKVKTGKAKTNKKYVKKYKKFFTKKNAGKKVKVTL